MRTATIGGARALGLDHLIGTLEEGKKADYIIVDARGLECPPGEAPSMSTSSRRRSAAPRPPGRRRRGEFEVDLKSVTRNS